MSTGSYLLSVVGLTLVAISMAVAGRTMRRALLPGWRGAPSLLAAGVLGLGTLIVLSELLGLFGLLDGVLLTAACVIVGAGALRIEPMLMASSAPGEAKGGAGPRDAKPSPPWELWVAVGFAFVVAVQWAGPTLLALDRGIYGGDSLWYHMPFAAHIAQTGSVTDLLFTDPLYLNWFYPQNSELLHADGLLLLGDDFLSPLLNLAWLGAALLAAWCIGRPYGAGAPAVAAVAALMSANLLFSRQPGNANNDVVAIALLLASVAILVNARSATARGPLIVAGLAAGLALGTKLTIVPPVGALTIGVIAIAASGDRLRAAGAWLAGLLAGGGLWYLRDLIASGTPFPFVDLGPFSMPEELEGREPFSIAHYLTDTDVWGRFFTPALEERLGDLWPLFLAAAVAGVVLWLWRAERLERMLAVVVAVSAVAYLLTPLGASGPEGSPVGFRLNIRYLAPALALGLVLAAIPPPLLRDGMRRWWRLGAIGLFAVLVAVGAGAAEGGQVLLDDGSDPRVAAARGGGGGPAGRPARSRLAGRPARCARGCGAGAPARPRRDRQGSARRLSRPPLFRRPPPTTRSPSSRRSSSRRDSGPPSNGRGKSRTRASRCRAPPARCSSTGSGARTRRTRSSSSASTRTGAPSTSTPSARSGSPPSTKATTTTS